MASANFISRNRNTFGSFRSLAGSIAGAFRAHSGVLERRNCLPGCERLSQFENLMFRRGELFFVAFDALMIDGEELRNPDYTQAEGRVELFEGLRG